MPPGNVKLIAAWTALILALSGAIELRVKIGTVSDRLDRVERILEQRYASNTDP
jgi:hypothetical protein